MRDWRASPSLTLLADGRVLVAGGFGAQPGEAFTGAEVYDEADRPLDTSRAAWPSGRVDGQTGTRLPDGRVLVAGAGGLTAELYDPTSGTWSAAAPMLLPNHGGQAATLMPDGQVLITGGSDAAGKAIATVERYDPLSDTWTEVAPLHVPRLSATAVMLPDGTVLVVGGQGADGALLASAELFDPDGRIPMTRSRRLTLSRSIAVALMASLAAAGVCAGSSSPPTAGTAPPAPSTTSSVPSIAAPLPSTSAAAARTPTPAATPAPFALLPEMPTAELDAATASRLQGALGNAVASGAPDFIAAVITEDGVWAGAAGIGGLNDRKATPNDEFAIASISKTFTAALVMRLAEQGRIVA